MAHRGMKNVKRKKVKSEEMGRSTKHTVNQELLPAELSREKLVNLLKHRPVEERELHGYIIPSRILDQLTPQEIRDLISVFKIFDSDSDGFMTASDLCRAMQALGFKLSRKECIDAVKDRSFKKDRGIDVAGFLDVVVYKQGDSIDTLAEIIKGFELIDVDKTGKLSIDNLKCACHDCGLKLTSQELKEMVEEADINGDGLVDQSEFIKIMLQTNLFT